MDFQLTPEQMEKALKVCDILNIEDFTVATIVLEQANWDLEKALSSMQQTTKHANAPPPPPAQAPHQEYMSYDFDEEPEQYEYQEYEEILEQEEDLNNKKKMFQNQYQSIPLNKTASETPNILQKQLSYDRMVLENYSHHRHEYQIHLMKNAQLFCQKILDSKDPKSPEVYKYYQSKKKNETNRKFISMLHQRYKTKINFTFGTFLLNLARSYLDKKFLLVYIHKSQFENNRSIQMLLTNKQIASFVNKYCISYGMFDSSDDYQVVQKYVPMKELPAFALFKFDKKGQKEDFISSYIVLQKDAANFMEWVATNIGVSIKKKENSLSYISKKSQQANSVITDHFRPSDIIFQQNTEYEEMARLYQLKRDLSKVKKQQIAQRKQEIQNIKKKFIEELAFMEGETISIKFRLPLSGKCLTRTFKNSDKAQQMFDYISSFGRQEFEDQYAEFDLTQTFPRISLMERREEIIGQIFEGSDRQNLIVKQL